MAKVSAIPQGLSSVIPTMTIKGCAEAIELYKKAFGAEEITRAADPSGKMIWHAALRLNGQTVFLNDEIPGVSGPARPTRLWLYVDGVDAAFQRATKAGCQVAMPITDMFWGDRFGQVVDQWGNEWMLAQHVKDMTPQELEQARKAFIAEMEKKKK